MQDKEIDVFDYDGKEYAIVEEIKNVIYAVNMKDSKDIVLFKSIIKDDGEYLEELDGQEKEQAYANFTAKHKDMSFYIRNLLKNNK